MKYFLFLLLVIGLNGQTLMKPDRSTFFTGAGGGSDSSNAFPAFAARPTLDDFTATTDTFYCDPGGDNSTGTGLIGAPWQDLAGATTGGAGSPVAPGDLIYFRHGTGADTLYPLGAGRNFAESDNNLTIDGTKANPIMISNYPGEIARWENAEDHWSMTLGGKYQKLIGTMVGAEYGIQIIGGMTFLEDNIQVSNVEISVGTYNGGDGNPSMLAQMVQIGIDTTIISHNYFHDSAHPPEVAKMSVIRMFISHVVTIQYNLFENNLNLTDGGVVYFKDHVGSADVSYNKFIGNKEGVLYYAQNNDDHRPDSILVHDNLYFDVDTPVGFRGPEGASSLYVYRNVCITTDGFFRYNFSGSGSNGDTGKFSDNFINGNAFEKGFLATADSLGFFPHFWEYNMYEAAGNQNDPFTLGLPAGVYDNSTVGPTGEVVYNPVTMTVRAPNDYAGKTAGEGGGIIGGFVYP